MKNAMLAICLSVLLTNAHAAGVDKRQALRLSPEQKNLVLEEMRAMLAATQAILSALPTKDMTTVAQQARAVGVGMLQKSEDHLQGALPPAFMQLGMATHEDFDRIAADAATTKDPQHTLQQLGDSLKKCITCHDTYRVQLVPAAPRGKAAR